MPKLSLEELQTVVSALVNPTKISQDAPFVPSTANSAGLLDKIGKMIFLDGLFADKLPEMDGEMLPLGKSIEEWYADLILPTNEDPTGAGALSPSDPTYRPVAYSYPLTAQKFKDTKRFNDLERACDTMGDYENLIMSILKRLYDSQAVYKYEAKKELLSVMADACVSAQATTATFSTSHAYAVNTFLRNGSTATRGVVVKPILVSNTDNWATLVASGYIVPIDLVSTAVLPVDTASGEAFVKLVKKYAKKAKFVSEGNSLNGNTVGAEQGLMLYVNSEIMSSIEVDVEAGTFQLDKVALPATLKELDDFGSDSNKVFAILVDSRTPKLFPTYQAMREQVNGDGDFINYFLHSHYTASYSKNVFVHIFKEA